MSDEVTPGFSRRRRAGEIIVNSMRSAESIVTTSGALDYTLRQYNASTNGLMSSTRVSVVGPYGHELRVSHSVLADQAASGSWTTSFGWTGVSSLESQLVARVLSNAASSEAAALVTLAEMGKTFELMEDMASSTAQIFKRIWSSPTSIRRELELVLPTLRGLNRSQALNRVRRIYARELKKGLSPNSAKALGLKLASAWLAYRYGVMATYYDVMSWVAASRQVGKARRARFATSTSSSYDSGLVGSTGTSQWAVESTFERRTRSTRSSAGCLVSVDLDASGFESYGAYNLLTSGWELVPFSFVIDWFVDVGERLAALEGKVLRPVLGSWIVHRHNLMHLRTWEAKGRRYNSGGIIYDSLGMSDYLTLTDECKIVTRSANPQLSVLPQIKVNLNWKRMTDSVALLLQISKGIRMGR